MKYIDRSNAETRWLDFKTRYYTGKDGKVLAWDFVERKHAVEAVIVVARTKESKSLIVIKQFRATFNDYIYELPAGLIDTMETPGQAALRELEEETGYRGRVEMVSGVLSSSAGLTNEKIYMVYVTCDEEPKSKVRLEMAEDIETMKLSPDQFQSFMSNSRQILDAKLYAVLEGGQDGNAADC